MLASIGVEGPPIQSPTLRPVVGISPAAPTPPIILPVNNATTTEATSTEFASETTVAASAATDITITTSATDSSSPTEQPDESTDQPLPLTGYAFFDSSADGTKDTPQDYGIYGITVELFTCGDSAAGDGSIFIDATTTDAIGYYSFSNDVLLGGLSDITWYAIDVPSIPDLYEFTNVWNGKADGSGGLMYPNVTSSINPETMRSKCFNLEEGGVREVNFGVVFAGQV